VVERADRHRVDPLSVLTCCRRLRYGRGLFTLAGCASCSDEGRSMTHLGQIRRGMVMGFFVALLAILVAIPGGVFLQAADHRDAPLIDEDPSADINDVFVFLNPNDPTKVIFAMTVNGFAVPAVRSSYSFAPEALYQFKIDNTGSAREALVTQDVFRQNGAFRGRPLHADGTSGVNGFGGFNVSGLVVEVPLAMIQGSANRAGTYLANNTTIGVWGTTGRTKMRKRHDEREND